MIGVSSDQVTLYRKETYKAYFDADDRQKIETIFDKIYQVRRDVSGAGNKFDKLLGMGNLVRHTYEGQDIVYNAPVSGPSILTKYHMFSDGLILTYEAVKDTVKVVNLMKELAGTWKESVTNEKEEFAARVFNKGGVTTGDWVFDGTHTGQTDSSGEYLYDGVCFFNATGNARSIYGTSDTFYNSVAGLTFNASNFQTLYVLMTATNNKNEMGRIFRNRPDTILTQPGTDSIAAWTLLNTMGQNQSKPGGQLNDRNAWANEKDSYSGTMQAISWDFLDDTGSPFYIGKRNHKSLQFHERLIPEIDFHQDPKNKAYHADIIMRMGIEISDFRYWVRGGGSSS